MIKQPVAFLDHPFHKKTRSSQFFLDALSTHFDVHIFYLEGDPRELMREIGDSSYQTVVCWQTEFCAPYFLMRGKRVICIPMYDGVANAPDWYWLPMRQARFINFAKVLHTRHKRLGIESLYVKYFGAYANAEQATFEVLKGFFWQRRPQEGLDYRFARRVFGNAVGALHVHNAPDTEDPADWEPDVDTSVTYFAADPSSYRDALASANVFLCPRRTEGIGHPLIEAMARGMCIVAHDMPTANEYISDGVNGILIDYDSPASVKAVARSLTRERAEALGKRARASYLSGRDEWERRAQRLPYFVSTCPKPDMHARDIAFQEKYLKISRFAHSDFHKYLHELMKLQQEGLLGAESSALGLKERAKWAVGAVPGAKGVWRISRRILQAIRRKLI